MESPAASLEQVQHEIAAPLALGGPFEVTKSLQDGKRRIIEGIISTPDEDLEGEEVSEKHSDYSYFLRRAAINKALLDRFDWSAYENRHGFIRWEHTSGLTCSGCGKAACFREPETIVGVPLEIDKSIAFKSLDGMPRVGTRMVAEIFPASANNAFADAAWLLMSSLEKLGTPRRIGCSIEGAYIDNYPGARKTSSPEKAILVSNCVLTTHPVNPYTMAWTQVRKSLLGIGPNDLARPAACQCGGTCCAAKAVTAGAGVTDAAALTGGASLAQQSHAGTRPRCRKPGCRDPHHHHAALDDPDVRKAVITTLLARGFSREVIAQSIAGRCAA